MPCLEVVMPKADEATRCALGEKLTAAFVDSAGYGGDIFAVHFNEYEQGAVYLNGELWQGEGVPYLHLLLYSPRLTHSVKVKLIEKLTAAFVECVGKEDWQPVIHLAEHPYDNVGVEGKPLSLLIPELAERRFYYDLPGD